MDRTSDRSTRDRFSRTVSLSSYTNGLSSALRYAAPANTTAAAPRIARSRELSRESVRLRKPGFCRRRPAANHARAARVRAPERNIAQCGLRVGLDLRFAVRAAAPAGNHEPGAAFHDALELVVSRHAGRMLLAERVRPRVERALDLIEPRRDRPGEPVHRHRLLLTCVATLDHHGRLLDVLGTDL